CVPAAAIARRILVPAQAGALGVGIFLIDPHAEGVVLERQVATNGEPLYTVLLTRAYVPPEDVLAPPDRGAIVVDWLAARAAVGRSPRRRGRGDRQVLRRRSRPPRRLRRPAPARRHRLRRRIPAPPSLHMVATDRALARRRPGPARAPRLPPGSRLAPGRC